MSETNVSVMAIATAIEPVTAVVHETQLTGESYQGPMVIGFYPDENDEQELWIEREGQRIQFSASSLDAVIKQLRRAKKLSQEMKCDS